MASFTDNPFAVLSLIAAPAVMTNASSILVLSTSNRLARAIDQTRATLAKLNSVGAKNDSAAKMSLNHLERLQDRTSTLRKALTAFYLSLGSFASASLISVLGAGVASFDAHLFVYAFLAVALVVGLIAVSALVFGCLLLVHETRFALVNLSEEAEFSRAEVQRRLKAEIS